MSPTLFLKKDAPPTVIFFGTSDAMLDHGQGVRREVQGVGRDGRNCSPPRSSRTGSSTASRGLSVTTRKADEFLTSLGYLKGEPTLKLPANAPELKNETDASKP